MVLFIVEDSRYPVLPKHMKLLKSYFDAVTCLNFSDDFSTIIDSEKKVVIENLAGDWSFYLYIISKVNIKGNVSFANSTLLYKHPFRYILNKINVDDDGLNLPIFYGISRRYGNGIVKSPNIKSPLFFSSFFMAMNETAFRLIKDECINNLQHIQESHNLNLEKMVPFMLLNYVINHTHNSKASYRHLASISSTEERKMQKMKAVCCEHIFSEFILSKCLVESCNISLSDLFRYKFREMLSRT